MSNDSTLAYKFSSNNMPALRKDKLCGCFYCLKIFDPKEIEEYLENDNPCDKEGTALCPYCGIDSVIGENSGYPITKDFLHKMYRRWFDSGSRVSLSTPYGNISLYYDGEPIIFDDKSLDPHPRYYPNVDATHRLTFNFYPDGSSHILRLVLEDSPENGSCEPGERFEAVTFYIGDSVITLGCEASFGLEKEDGYDFYGTILSNGIELAITPETKQQKFVFGVCWKNKVTDKEDVQTWFGADPTIT